MRMSKRFGLLKIILLGCSLSFINSAYSVETSCKHLKGKWVNELGSTLIISKIKENGRISGRFISPLKAGAEEFLVLGWANDLPPPEGLHHFTAITFAVNWGAYGSLSSWSGGCAVKEGVATMSMIWNLVLANAQFEWDHMLSNSDSFTPKQ